MLDQSESEVSESGDEDATAREVQVVSDGLPRRQSLLLAEHLPPLVVHLVSQEAHRVLSGRAVRACAATAAAC